MRIKEVIKEKGLTVGAVASRMGVVPQALSRVINGNPTVEMVERVAVAIGVPASELFEKPSNGNFTCPNCGAEIQLEGKLMDGTGRIPDHENIRGAEYYK